MAKGEMMEAGSKTGCCLTDIRPLCNCSKNWKRPMGPTTKLQIKHSSQGRIFERILSVFIAICFKTLSNILSMSAPIKFCKNLLKADKVKFKEMEGSF